MIFVTNSELSVSADKAKDFPRLSDAHAVLRLLGTVDAVLLELDRGSRKSAVFGVIVRALTTEVQSERRSSFASNIALYAFAPIIEHEAPVGC